MLHKLNRKTKNKASKRVGRGGKHAKTSGRGTKGQNARAGHKKRPEIRDFIKRLPKMRGRGKNINTSIKSKPFIVDVSSLSVFKNGESVNPKSLLQKGLIETIFGKIPAVKILGKGELSVKISVSGCSTSVGAKESILKAGGSVQ